MTSTQSPFALSLLLLTTMAIAGIQASSVDPPSLVDPAAADESSAESAALLTSVQDPLNSPHPIPWQWIEETQSITSSASEAQTRYYRSHALISPDGQYAAYSRIQLEMLPGTAQDRVTSMLFLEQMQTGDLQFVTASSPQVKNPNITAAEYEQPGMMAVLTPVAWSESGDRLLVRGFESRFGTDLASDYAVIWDRTTGGQRAIVPTNISYSNAVLLGWSQTHANQVLFRAGSLSDESWPMVAVNSDGMAIAAESDQPVVYGQISRDFWNGPQA
ncbi:MAG: hypothetical protein WBA57_17760, partial [Elainellaceae cyanobacterium]